LVLAQGFLICVKIYSWLVNWCYPTYCGDRSVEKLHGDRINGLHPKAWAISQKWKK